MNINKKYLIIVLIIIVILIVLVIYYYFNNEVSEEIITFENGTELLNDLKDIQNEKEEFIIVHVIGEVNMPGIVKIKEGSRIIDAIEYAGGATNKANLAKINLAYILTDGEQIYIPNIDEDKNNESNLDYEYNSKKININLANKEELTKIPGIGESTAQKIINYRKEKGKFKSIEEIKNINGIGDSKFNNIKDYICVK